MKQLVVAFAIALVLAIGCGPGDVSDAASVSSTGSSAAEVDCATTGRWRIGEAFMRSEIEICVERDGIHRVHQVFEDGSTYDAVLTPVDGMEGTRFWRDEAGGSTDYYEFLPSGNLEVGDEAGAILIAARID